MIARLPDSTLPLRRQGYSFISSTCDRLGADMFQTSLLLRPVVCIRGEEAAEFFYDGGRFGRTRAMPRSAQHLLQDAGSVQSLEGAAHRHRKALFLDLAEGAGAQELGSCFDDEWDRAERRWPRRINLYEEVSTVLASAVFRWAGLPADHGTAAARARDLRLMVERAGTFGPANWHARRRRRDSR